MPDLHYLSPAAYERLSAELDDLVTRGRTEIAIVIERARELGDLSENGDYHAAKDQQGLMEARIVQLEKLLKSAVIVEETDTSKVAAGSIVTFVYDGDDDDQAETFLIGSMEEKRPGLDVITPGSALGASLLGRLVGDEVTYDAPNGSTLKVRILKVEG